MNSIREMIKKAMADFAKGVHLSEEQIELLYQHKDLIQKEGFGNKNTVDDINSNRFVEGIMHVNNIRELFDMNHLKLNNALHLEKAYREAESYQDSKVFFELFLYSVGYPNYYFIALHPNYLFDKDACIKAYEDVIGLLKKGKTAQDIAEML